MRIHVFFLPSSMPLAFHLCLVAASALLILLCSSTSCLGTQYQDCLWDKYACAGVEFGYPFGKNGSGCGDPQFQLHSCDSDSHPLLDISGNEYHISESSFLGNDGDHRMTLLSDNLWGGKCNLSGNYSQFWRSSSHFHIVHGYNNLTLWRLCDKSNEKMYQLTLLKLCGEDWYYDIWRPEEGTRFCKSHIQIPIKNEDLQSNEFIIDQTFPWQGFEITWNVDSKKSLLCEDCLKSQGSCGYNISEATTFLCYCPDGTSHPHKCPANVSDNSSYGGNISSPAKTTIIVAGSVGGVALIAVALVLFITHSAKKGKPCPIKGPVGDFSKYERNDMGAVCLGVRSS